ncbi:hypothetical protein Bca101_101210 [Brassica carinata]
MTVRQHAYQHADPSRGLSGDFRHEECPSVRISARWALSVDYPRDDFRHEDCPWVIFATRTVRGDFRHEDCPPDAYQHPGPSRGLTLAHPVDYPGEIFAREDCPWVIFATRGLSRKTHISTLALPVDCPGDFRHEDSTSVHISARWPLPVDYPWVIFATMTVRRVRIFSHAGPVPSRRISVHADSPSRGLSAVIFATRTVRQYAYQHAGPSRGLSVVIFATRTVRGTLALPVDCPVIFAHEERTSVRISARWPFPWDYPWTVRQYAYQHVGPSRGLSGCFSPTRTVRQYAYQHVGPSRGLSVGDCRPRGLSGGDFRHETVRAEFRPRGLSVSTHISTLALPVDYPWVIFAHEDCPWVIFAYEDCPWVIFAHEDCPSVRISARSPFPWTVRVLFAHEDSTSVHISARWPFPWTVRVIFATRTVRQ